MSFYFMQFTIKRWTINCQTRYLLYIVTKKLLIREYISNKFRIKLLK